VNRRCALNAGANLSQHPPESPLTMTVQNVIDRIAETLQVPADQLNLESHASDFDAWDSLGTMSLLLMLTSDYELTVPQGETQKLLSVRGIVELFERAGKLS
jgi:acyl carrier protein